MFKTAWNRGETIPSELGNEFIDQYEYRINKKTGKRMLTKVGQTNLYEKIQANLESSKLENIIKKCTEGDLTALNIKEGNYVDITNLPTNMMDLQNIIIKTKQEFDKLPADIRKKFDNSAEKYVSEYGSEMWADALGFKKETQNTTSTPEPVVAEKEEE